MKWPRHSPFRTKYDLCHIREFWQLVESIRATLCFSSLLCVVSVHSLLLPPPGWPWTHSSWGWPWTLDNLALPHWVRTHGHVALFFFLKISFLRYKFLSRIWASLVCLSCNKISSLYMWEAWAFGQTQRTAASMFCCCSLLQMCWGSVRLGGQSH